MGSPAAHRPSLTARAGPGYPRCRCVAMSPLLRGGQVRLVAPAALRAFVDKYGAVSRENIASFPAEEDALDFVLQLHVEEQAGSLYDEVVESRSQQYVERVEQVQVANPAHSKLQSSLAQRTGDVVAGQVADRVGGLSGLLLGAVAGAATEAAAKPDENVIEERQVMGECSYEVHKLVATALVHVVVELFDVARQVPVWSVPLTQRPVVEAVARSA